MRCVLMLTTYLAATLAMPSALAEAESQAGTGPSAVPEEFGLVATADQYAEIERFLELVKLSLIHISEPTRPY